MQWAIGVIIGVLVVACGEAVTWENRTVDNVGSVCLYDDAESADASIQDDGDATQSIGTEQAAFVSFTAGDCLSSTCSRNAQTDCAVDLDGNTLSISGSATYEHKTGRDVACSADCGLMQASFDTPMLPAGTYTIEFGGKSDTLDIPYCGGTLCLDTCD